MSATAPTATRERLTRSLDDPSRSLLIAVGLTGIGVGVGAVLLLLSSDVGDGGPGFAAIAVLIAWSFIGAGLTAWRHRPESRIGPLMVAVGFAWAANALIGADVPALLITGLIVANVWVVLLFQLLLTFPEGRLRTRPERLLLGAAWVSGVLLQIPPLLFQSFPDPAVCDRCASNPILLSDDPGLADLLFSLQALVAVPALIGLLVLLVRRWRGATKAQRGAFVPLLWVGGAVMALLALQLASLALDIDRDIADTIFTLLLLPFLLVPYAFLAGVLRTHLSREAAVSRLLEGLRELPVQGGEPRDLLAEALGDPSLQLGYWLPSASGYIDHDGRALDLEREGGDRFVSVVERERRRIGVLICDPALAAQGRLVEAVGAAAALALENERLEAELRARVEELRASRARIVEAADGERRRLERDLHDGAQQQLVALALNLRLARSRLESDPQATGELLDEAAADLEVATAELRELARGIHPAVLSDRGLRAGLQALAGRATLPVEIAGLPEERFPSGVEAAAYFVVAEALTNVSRYAEASAASVSVLQRNGDLEVAVRDDGIGGADPAAGSGLRGLADRVAALDGRLEVESPPGGGTTVRAVIPCG